MKSKIILIIVISICLYCNLGFGDILYVDNRLTHNCASYDPQAGRGDAACGTGSSRAYRKIQDAINAMNTGDTIYIRGGAYHETNPSTNCMIDIPTSKNGDSWQEGHYSTLASYPGEWAVIDGQSSAPKGVVLGHKGMSDYNDELHYWKFELLEITGGCSPGDDDQGGAALWLPGGPFIVRFCYFHDNWDDSELNNPSAITTYRLHDSIIEFNYFKHNACSCASNCGQLTMYSDYKASWDQVDINHAIHRNIIRYNLFDGGGAAYGFKNKAQQILGPIDESNLAYKEYGDKIHHNIFLNHCRAGVEVDQSYIQVYNNIFDGDAIWRGEYNQKFRLYVTIYNNTILNGYYISWGARGGQFNPKEFLLNNILDNSPVGNDESRSMTFGPYSSAPVDVSDLVIQHNYWYRPQGTEAHLNIAHQLNGSSSKCNNFTVSLFDKEYGYTNYMKSSSESSDKLMEGSYGAEKYITRSEHIVSSGVTIGNGGIGTNHPYLSGVKIPSYLGATNPNDHEWVHGVLDQVSDPAWLASQTAEPRWVEGHGGGQVPGAPPNLGVVED